MQTRQRDGGDGKRSATRKSRKPGQFKAQLALAAFVLVAAATLALTSAGVIHTVVASTTAGQVAAVNLPMIEVIR